MCKVLRSVHLAAEAGGGRGGGSGYKKGCEGGKGVTEQQWSSAACLCCAREIQRYICKSLEGESRRESVCTPPGDLRASLHRASARQGRRRGQCVKWRQQSASEAAAVLSLRGFE